MTLSAEFKNVAKSVAIALPLLGATAFTVLNSGSLALLPIIATAFILGGEPRIEFGEKTLRLNSLVKEPSEKMGFKKPPEIYASSLMEGAGATSKNKIFVASYLSRKLPDDELTFIIAHELAHIKRKDLLLGETHGNSDAGSASMFVSWLLLTAVSSVKSTIDGAGAEQSLVMADSLLATMLATSFYVASRKFMTEKKTEKKTEIYKMEFDCDRRAVEATGDVGAAISFMERLRGRVDSIEAINLESLEQNIRWSTDDATHPSWKRRSAALLALKQEKSNVPSRGIA